MKDELQLKLVEILTAIQVGVGKSADFALEQLPDIAQQYLLYGKVWSIAYTLVWLAVVVGSFWITCKFGFFSKRTNAYGDWDESRIAVVLVGSLVSVCTVIGFLYSLHNLLLISFAPKVWLLKEIARLL